jgi:AraC-like DNA-binding protein
METPELGVSFGVCDLRTPFLRIARMQSRGVITDWGLVDRAMPFVHRNNGARVNVTIVVEGVARFEERARCAHMDRGDIVISRSDALGTEAYAGERSVALAMEWDPDVLGAPAGKTFSVDRLDERSRARIAAAAMRLECDGANAALEIFGILRAYGFPLMPVAAGDLADPVAADLRRLQDALSSILEALHVSPTIEDVATALGWDHRRVHRRMTALRESYRHTWAHWRDLAHRARIAQALRLLSARGATTERVARLTGFRAPTGLCHAFAELGLPSPGTLSCAARVDGLARWGELIAPNSPPLAREA